MIRQLVRPFSITKNLIKLSSFMSSVSPTPNEGPKDNKNISQIDAQILNKKNQKESQPSSPVSRAQARLRLSRSELAKFARVELEYEKLHLPTQKMELIANQLSDKGFKIKPHPQLGTRLQFHRDVVIKKKKASKKAQNDENKDSKEEKSQSKQKQIDEKQEQDREWEIKIFTSAQNNFVTEKEAKYLQQIYNAKKLYQEIVKEAAQGLKNVKIELKLHVDYLKIKNPHLHKILQKLGSRNFQKSVDDNDEQMYLNDDDRYKEFTVYLRNGSAKEIGKWVKLQLMLEDFRFIHIYKMSVVNDMERELSGEGTDSIEYKKVQSRVQGNLIYWVNDLLQSKQGLGFSTLTDIYCYTKHSEALHYRKWLQDLIDITK